MNAMVKKYNKELESLVNQMPINYPDVTVYGAVYDIVHQFRATPTRYRIKSFI